MRDLKLEEYLADYPDFPKKGIVFRDISPLLANPNAFSAALDAMVNFAAGVSFNKIVAVDARGFIFGGALADRLQKSLVLCRKASKLPGAVVTESYGYEYSNDSLSIQSNAITAQDRVLIIDDVLASGNTSLAAHKLVEQLGATVPAMFFLIELTYLPGRALLEKHKKNVTIKSVIQLGS